MQDRGTTSLDIELLVWWFVRNHYENTQRYFPVALKYLIKNFSMKIFQSKLLTIKLDLDLIDLLSKQMKFEYPKLLYKPSQNEHASDNHRHPTLSGYPDKFHKSCDAKGATLTLIKSEYGNIFGVYTDIPWSESNKNVRDLGKTLFLFLLSSHDEHQECPKIWRATGDGIKVRNLKGLGPIFGCHEVAIVNNKCVVFSRDNRNISSFDPILDRNALNQISGANKDYKIFGFDVDCEVFAMY